MATKKQKRLIGEARQAQHLKDSRESGLKAQINAHEDEERRRKNRELLAQRESERLEAILALAKANEEAVARIQSNA
jgi:hypothetical protein